MKQYRKIGDGPNDWLDPWGMPVRDPVVLEALNRPAPAKRTRPRKPPLPPGKRNPGVKVRRELTKKLRRLCARTKPGECVETETIARECGVSATTILEIERGAFRKLRAILPPSLLKEWREMLHSANKAV